ncbi:MAG: hypothetical protein ACLGSD_11070 [Acidobacteriota bacterium]
MQAEVSNAEFSRAGNKIETLILAEKSGAARRLLPLGGGDELSTGEFNRIMAEFSAGEARFDDCYRHDSAMNLG